MSADFALLYSKTGRPSIAPEKLLRALLLQAFYTIRSERQLMDQLDYNLLMENAHARIVDVAPTRDSGTAEREAALAMLARRDERRGVTLGAD